MRLRQIGCWLISLLPGIPRHDWRRAHKSEALPWGVKYCRRCHASRAVKRRVTVTAQLAPAMQRLANEELIEQNATRHEEAA